MARKRYLLLMAGGSGIRMGADRPKQFIEIHGKAVLHHTMDKFISAVPDIKVVTVLPQEYKTVWKSYCLSHNLIVTQTIVSGGITRFHSVRKGLESVPDDVLVAVHDGVRPCLSETFIRRIFEEADNNYGVVPVIPCTDTVKFLEKDTNGRLFRADPVKSIDRSMLFLAQTPQIFRSEILKKAYSGAFRPEFTDDASVAEANGTVLKFVDGERYNIKLTTPDDLLIASALLRP